MAALVEMPSYPRRDGFNAWFTAHLDEYPGAAIITPKVLRIFAICKKYRDYNIGGNEREELPDTGLGG
jgi:hypothetical protein